MTVYTVEWKLEVDADNPTDAARQAFEYQQTQKHKKFLVLKAYSTQYQDGDVIDLAQEKQ
jgi:hypothetical protein